MAPCRCRPPPSPAATPSSRPCRRGHGALRRAARIGGYRGADYDFISAHTLKTAGNAPDRSPTPSNQARAQRGARADHAGAAGARAGADGVEQRQHATRRSVARCSSCWFRSRCEPFLGGTTEMVLELDSGTAGIPWEAARRRRRRRRRCAALGDSRQAVAQAAHERIPRPASSTPAADASVLVHRRARSATERSIRGLRARAAKAWRWSRDAWRPSIARRDRVRVHQLARRSGDAGADASTVINALLERDWRIVHIAGHGEPPTGRRRPARRRAVRRHLPRARTKSAACASVPELVFVNCCHLAARTPRTAALEARSYDRARFASGVAER